MNDGTLTQAAHPRRRLLLLVLPGLLLAASFHAEPSTHEISDVAEHPSTSVAYPSPSTLSNPARDTFVGTLGAPAPDVRSSSVLVLDETDSSVLYAKNARRVAPIASITKLMTALVVLDAQQPLDELLQIGMEERNIISRLAVGTRASRSDLLHLALMSSENRAAQTLGRCYPGGLSAFVAAMNAKAKTLGMTSARFVDPTGLSSQNVANAADLSKLVIAAANDPVIRSFSTNVSHAVTVGKQLLEYRNTNTLVRKVDWDIQVQKTGYTQDAGQCLVMKTTIQGRPMVIVLLNSVGKYTRVADARRIRTWMETASPQPHLARSDR